MDNFSYEWSVILGRIKTITFIDIIDIALVSILLYYVYKFIRDRRAGKLAAGIVFLLLLQAVSTALEMNAMKTIMQNVFQVGLLAVVVVFQPELRSALEKMGGEPFKGLKLIGAENRDLEGNFSAIKEICDAVSDLAADKTGALIVIERTTRLGDIIKSGVEIDAQTSSFLLKNIFFNKAPLHDGAVIIRGGRIYAAGCFLPLSQNESIVKDLGTRHRAGIGISEDSDAVVVIVSEETGIVSVSVEGQLTRGYNYNSLKAKLEELLVEDKSAVKKVSDKIGSIGKSIRKKDDGAKKK